MFPTSYGQALNNAGYQQAINGYFNGNRYDPSAAYAAQQGSVQNAQQQSAAPSTYSNRVELEKELAYNENEIRYLQNQLENMRAEWMDQDSFDRKLAANRAAIGDFGNARAHQNDIIARQNDRNRLADTAMQWRWQAAQNKIAREADQRKQAKADIKRILGEIDDIDTAIPYHSEPGAVKALETKRARLVRELAAYGVSPDVQNVGATDVPNPAAGGPQNLPLKQEEATYTDNKGFFIDANSRETLAKKYDERGMKEEAKRVRNTPTVQENQKKKDEWEKGRKEVVSLIEKHRAKTQAEIATLTNKVNAKSDPDIKKILKYATYDQKNGQFRMKE